MRIISPSILSADFAELAKDVKTVVDAGAEYIHIDVMDGHFVPNMSIGPCIVASLRKKSDAFFDVHLMIENPEKYAESFAKAGADLITVHIEAVKDMDEMIKKLRELGVKVGLSLNPETPIDAILPYVSKVDMVLVMTVHPGFGGQTLIFECLDKVKYLRENYPALDIEVDGGVKLDNVKACVDAGANVIVAGSAIFEAENVAEVVRTMKEI